LLLLQKGSIGYYFCRLFAAFGCLGPQTEPKPVDHGGAPHQRRGAGLRHRAQLRLCRPGAVQPPSSNDGCEPQESLVARGHTLPVEDVRGGEGKGL